MSLWTPYGKLLARRSANNSSSIDFDDELDSNFSEFLLRCSSVEASAGTNIEARVGTGSTYDSTTNYAFRSARITNSAMDVTGAINNDSMFLTHDSVLTLTANSSSAFDIRISNPGDATLYTKVRLEGIFDNATGQGDRLISGAFQLIQSAATSFQLFPTSGVFESGEFELFGVS